MKSHFYFKENADRQRAVTVSNEIFKNLKSTGMYKKKTKTAINCVKMLLNYPDFLKGNRWINME